MNHKQYIAKRDALLDEAHAGFDVAEQLDNLVLDVIGEDLNNAPPDSGTRIYASNVRNQLKKAQRQIVTGGKE